jgi:hypothetical protein
MRNYRTDDRQHDVMTFFHPMRESERRETGQNDLKNNNEKKRNDYFQLRFID